MDTINDISGCYCDDDAATAAPKDIRDRTLFAMVFNAEGKYSFLTAEAALLASGHVSYSRVAAPKPTPGAGLFGSIFSSESSTSLGSASSSGSNNATKMPQLAARAVHRDVPVAVISGISGINFPFVHTKIQAYLTFSVGDLSSVERTDIRTGPSPTWDDQEYCLPLLGTHKTLLCSLFYKGAVYGEDKVAVAEVPITSLNFASIEDETFPLDFSIFPKAQRLLEKLVEKGQHQEMPGIKLTIRLRTS